MLVLSFQKEFVLERIFNGGYKAKMGRSEFCRMSERFYKGYRKVKDELSKVSDMAEWESPVWAWIGEPVVGSWANGVAVFADVPANEMVFSDYERYCEYIESEDENLNFMLPYEEAVKEACGGSCVQACFAGLNPERVVAVMGVDEIRESVRRGAETVDDLYRGIKL